MNGDVGKHVISYVYRDKRQTNEEQKTEIASGEFEWLDVCVCAVTVFWQQKKTMMDWEGKSTDPYTYHSIACLPINFRAGKTVQNTPPIVETEVLYHPLNGLLIPITNYVA